MLESLFFTIFHYGHFLLALTLAPALLTAWLRGRKMTGLGWRNSSLAGLGGGFLGIAVAVAWFFLAFHLQEDALLFAYAVLPVPSAAGAWMICGLWMRRLRPQ